MAEQTTAAEPMGIKWGPIRLLSGITQLNMGTYLFGAGLTMLLATFIPQAQPFILTEILRIPHVQQGQVSGYLGLAHTLVAVIMPGIWGTLSDRTSRRIVYALGLMIAAIGIATYPLAATIVALLLFRMLFSAGISAANTMNNALLGDYVAPGDRGKAYGIVSVSGGLGALITVFVLLRLPAIFQEMGLSPVAAGRYTFWVAALIALLGTLVVINGLVGRPQQQAEKRSVVQIAREALHAAATNPNILLAYGVNFVASGTLSAMGTFFSLWLVNYGVTQAGITSAEALARAGMIIGLAQIVGLVASPFFGVLSDRFGRVRSVILATSLTAVVFAATLLISNPLSGTIFVLGVFLGLAQVSGIITGGALIAHHAPESVRGAVMGFYGFCGSLGIMLVFVLGGWLFDRWLYQGPFVLVAILCLVVTIWGFLVNKRKS
ncbi:MFS transporter [uncultured Thermanaerothrix sp.]|uniref:MFS transporter n=1 Tax=uncultured Thermanaerothrix sp. TaxID=1195149 RepID=UPI00261B691C|nr:MFS transporter [uncultured Thermanaerothrix sp.]